jgi:hypothetical protein
MGYPGPNRIAAGLMPTVVIDQPESGTLGEVPERPPPAGSGSTIARARRQPERA